jgi:ribosome-associated heat shock protein Hsp15
LQRVDKFLWYARFFKSRTLAATMVSAGRVRINGARCEKPSTLVKLDDVLTFPAGPHVRVIKVLAGGERRGPAPEARLPTKIDAPPRGSASERRLPAKGAGRPTKKERREISTFTRGERDD